MRNWGEALKYWWKLREDYYGNTGSNDGQEPGLAYQSDNCTILLWIAQAAYDQLLKNWPDPLPLSGKADL